jgi:hypothetical protein
MEHLFRLNLLLKNGLHTGSKVAIVVDSGPPPALGFYLLAAAASTAAEAFASSLDSFPPCQCLVSALSSLGLFFMSYFFLRLSTP